MTNLTEITKEKQQYQRFFPETKAKDVPQTCYNKLMNLLKMSEILRHHSNLLYSVRCSSMDNDRKAS